MEDDVIYIANSQSSSIEFHHSKIVISLYPNKKVEVDNHRLISILFQQDSKLTPGYIEVNYEGESKDTTERISDDHLTVFFGYSSRQSFLKAQLMLEDIIGKNRN